MLDFTSGNIPPCYICLLKTIWVFLRGHFMSRAATRGTVWCKHRFNYEVGVFGRKVCVPGSVCTLPEADRCGDFWPGKWFVTCLQCEKGPLCCCGKTLSTQLCLQPRVWDCRHASEDPSTAHRSKNTGQNQMETKQHHHISPAMCSVRLPPN